MKNEYKTKSIAEAALFFVIVCLTVLLSIYSTVIGMILTPIPIAILYLKYNKSIGILSIVVSGFLIAILGNIILAFATIIIYGITGMVFGICLKRNFKALRTIFVISIINALGMFFNVYVLSYLIVGTSIYEEVKMFSDKIKSMPEFYASMGIDITKNPGIENLNNITPEAILSMIPIITIICAVIAAYVTYIICKKIMEKLGVELNSITSFSTWYLDSRFAAILIVLTCVSLYAMKINQLYFNYFYTTMRWVLDSSFIIIGLSVVVYFLRNKLKMTKGAVMMTAFFALLSPLINVLYIIGLIDILIDIRGIDPESLGNIIRKKISNKK
jgi:uncharacterized protein YybS (DUF2232 family)